MDTSEIFRIIQKYDKEMIDKFYQYKQTLFATQYLVSKK